MNGRLAAFDLLKGTLQSVYQCPTDEYTVLTVNIVNRNAIPVNVKIAVTDDVNTVTAVEYIEHGTEIPAKGQLERTGVIVGQGQFLSVVADETNVNVVAWGTEIGNSVSVDPIPPNIDIYQEEWNIPTVYGGEAYSHQLAATDSGSPTFSVAGGALPNGLTLNSSTGVISGTADFGTYNANGDTFTATIAMTDTLYTSTNSVKPFNIVRKWLDGSTVQQAAPSGNYLATNFSGFSQGFYWIKNSNMPQPLQMWVDFTEEGGGYDFYLIRNDQILGPDCRTVGMPHAGDALGLDIVYPRSREHWRAMSRCVLANDPGGYDGYFQTCYAVHKTTGGGNYTGTIMRSTYYGSGSSDHRVPDGGRWWLRNSTFGEPNGDYVGYAFFGLRAGGYQMPNSPNLYNLGDIGFNDGNQSYALGATYLLSTNAKP